MITISAAKATQQRVALELMFHRLPADEMQVQIADVFERSRLGEFSLDGLLLAEEDGHPVAASLYVLQADGTALIWPPVSSKISTADDATNALLREMSRQIDLAGAWLGQCLVEPENRDEREALIRNEFRHLADLRFLQRPLIDPLPALKKEDYELVVYDPETNRERFERVLERSYIETLDCPEFNGLRTAGEALVSHQLSGQFDPSLWRIFCCNGNDVGLLLLSNHPEQSAREVVYVGVDPESRGHSHGSNMVLTALHEACQAGCCTVFLAVDSRNSYANRLYRKLGFSEIAVRCVHIRTPRRDSGST